MRTTAVSGIIFANTQDHVLNEISAERSMASVPFGGRYRLIDFTLSNMVNAGISNVAILTKGNYRSLMDHLGSGIFWDLDRKNGGLHIFPPYITSGTRRYHNYIEALYGALDFIKRCNSDYIVLSSSAFVANIDLTAAIRAHAKSNADATLIYTHGKAPKNIETTLYVTVGDDNKIVNGRISTDGEENVDYLLDIIIFKREVLAKLVKEVYDNGGATVNKDIILENINSLKLYGFEHKGYASVMDSVNTYFNTNMDLLNFDIRSDLFKNSMRPIFTKTRDDMPTRYGTKANVDNSFIGDGCIIEGTVKNSVLFRGVKVEKGAVVENCILMQGSSVAKDANLKYVITDKNAAIGSRLVLMGTEEKALIVNKNQSI